MAGESLGARIRRFRAGRDRSEVAAAAGMPATTIQYLEDHGSNKTEMAYLVGLARAFQISIEELVTGEKTANGERPPPPLSTEEQHVIDTMRGSSARRALILAYIAGMAVAPGPKPRKPKRGADKQQSQKGSRTG